MFNFFKRKKKVDFNIFKEAVLASYHKAEYWENFFDKQGKYYDEYYLLEIVKEVFHDCLPECSIPDFKWGKYSDKWIEKYYKELG